MNTITESNEKIFRLAFKQECSKLTADIVVDIGSGDGKYSLKLSKLAHASKIICVDHDLNSLKIAKKRGCLPIYADLNQKIPLPTNTADLVIVNQVIEHVAKTDLLVKEVRRILKPGGQSIWCTPNLASWHNIISLVAGHQPFSSQVSDETFIGNPWHPKYYQKINEAQAHLRLFTRRSLRELLTLHHLKIYVEKGIGYYSPIKFPSTPLSVIDPVHAAYLFTVAIKA